MIIGKKSWGLFQQQWTDGICEGTFTKKEILSEFEKFKIVIPDCLLEDFENTIYKKVKKKYFDNF